MYKLVVMGRACESRARAGLGFAKSGSKPKPFKKKVKHRPGPDGLLAFYHLASKREKNIWQTKNFLQPFFVYKKIDECQIFVNIFVVIKIELIFWGVVDEFGQ